MNASLLAVLNDAERLLVAETGRAELAALDEDAAIELETRIRRARNKYVGQYAGLPAPPWPRTPRSAISRRRPSSPPSSSRWPGQVGTPVTLGTALRVYAAAADAGHSARRERSGQSVAGESLAEAVRLLESIPARYELALALTDLGAFLRGTHSTSSASPPGLTCRGSWIVNCLP